MEPNLKEDKNECEHVAKSEEDIRNCPNPEYLKCLLEMGISQKVAETALKKTNWASLDAAASCALELNECSDDDQWEDIDESFKMVLIVNSSLNMSIGKTAAQVAHAAVGLYRVCLMDKPEECVKLACWQDSGEKKIVLNGKDTAELLALGKKADMLKVANYSVRDAGLTEIPANSLTVLGLFGTSEEVDQVSKVLRLL